jgi:hypothetical protein
MMQGLLLAEIPIISTVVRWLATIRGRRRRRGRVNGLILDVVDELLRNLGPVRAQWSGQAFPRDPGMPGEQRVHAIRRRALDRDPHTLREAIGDEIDDRLRDLYDSLLDPHHIDPQHERAIHELAHDLHGVLKRRHHGNRALGLPNRRPELPPLDQLPIHAPETVQELQRRLFETAHKTTRE